MADGCETEILGKGFITTVTVVVLEHPSALVPVTLEVVVDVGFAVTVAPVVPLSPVAGNHE
jgi:hypothetical protein